MQEIIYAQLQKGTMIRGEDGRKYVLTIDGQKQLPQLPKWSDTQQLHRASTLSSLNNLQSPIAIHCGLSNLLVIDFDDDLFSTALQLNNSLASHLQCTNISKSVDKEGGHFLYRFTENDLTAFINNANGCKLNKLDTLYGNTLLYATTPRNQTKKALISSDELISIPLAMQLLIINHYQKHRTKVVINKDISISYTASKLGLIAKDALDNDEAMQQLLAIITPNRFKEEMALKQSEHHPYHPDRVPDGSGYNYILALSRVLMLDPSIDKELHKRLILKINDMFSTPLTQERVQDNILARDLDAEDYQYNPEWRTTTLSLISKQKHPLEVYMSERDGANRYLVVDTISSEVTLYKTSKSVRDYILNQTGKIIKDDKLNAHSAFVKILDRPELPFGKQQDQFLFNIYRQNKEQIVFSNPALYREEWEAHELSLPYNQAHPRYPTTTLAMLKNSCGTNYNNFLSFIRRKFKTREHSPLFFVFHGVPHSGKSSIVNGILAPLANRRYISIDYTNATSQFNSWVHNKDIILIDEAHHIPAQQLKSIVQWTNTVTGSDKITNTRSMYSDIDSKEYKQEATIIFTSNAPFKATTEANDRRMVVFSTHLKASEALNMLDADIHRCIQEESVNFAYYLAVAVADADDSLYKRNDLWKSEIYTAFVERAETSEVILAKALVECDLEELLSILMSLGVTPQKFVKCLSFNKGARLRLHNSNEQLAKTPGVLNGIEEHINIRQFKGLLPVDSTDLLTLNAKDGGVKYIGYNIQKALTKYLAKKKQLVVPLLTSGEELLKLLGINVK